VHAALKWSLPFLFAVLFWASFHPLNLGFLAWVSLVPLLLFAKVASGRKAFLVAWLGGSLAFGACFWWVRYTVPVGPYFLGLYKGLYVALFVSIIRRFGPIWSPAAWVALEYVRGYLLSGLPWFLVGYTQHDLYHTIQVADLGGVWLVSGLVAFVNAALVDGRACVKRLAALAVVLSWVYGMIRLGTIPMTDGPKIGIVQPNIPQDVKMDILNPDQDHARKVALESYEKHVALTEAVARAKPDLIVWPEAAIYRGIFFNPESKRWERTRWYERICEPAQSTGIQLLTGLLVFEPGERPEDGVFTNSAVRVSPELGIVDRFDKVHLVPFAEYIPFTSVIPGMRDLIHRISGLRLEDMRPGSGFPVWELAGSRFGTQICFEAIFPEISREIARNGASFTVNISNDGWFRDSAELDQMLVMARFRAIENRMHVVRATNTGISAFIEPTGRIQDMIAGREVEGTLTAKVKVTSVSSLFRHWGNWIAWLAVLGMGARMARFIFVDRKKRTA
jgi:apolipoprotein N-acyltransferase